LSWNPGNQEITATAAGKKASGRGRDLVPTHLQDKFFKKKSLRATVIVEKKGNAFWIVSIS